MSLLKDCGKGALHHIDYFMKDFTFTTSVSGEGRSTAVVSVNANAHPIWSCTLTDAVREHVTRSRIDGLIPVYGNVIIEEGATFTLTPPTETTDGKVVFEGVVTTNPDSQKFTLTLFSWPLSSVS